MEENEAEQLEEEEDDDEKTDYIEDNWIRCPAVDKPRRGGS